LAILLPFLTFMFVVVIDWARVFYYSITITNCACNGAMYMARSQTATLTDGTYSDAGIVNLYLNATPDPVTAAALADASNITPTPTVTSATGSDTYGNYVTVTVSYQFQTVSGFSGWNFLVPASTNVTSTCKMYTQPEAPN
jgi:Flp pilus assembly protein TadG